MNEFNFPNKRKMSNSNLDIIIPKRGRPRKNNVVSETTKNITTELTSQIINQNKIEKQENIIKKVRNNTDMILFSKKINKTINDTQDKLNFEQDIEEKIDNTFIKKVEKDKINSSINTEILLKNINCIKLDKKYSLKEMNEYNLRNSNIKNNCTIIQNDNDKLYNQQSSVNTNSISNITKILENLSISKETLKPSELLNFENNNIQLYYSLHKENKKRELPKQTDVCCYYCRHSFNTKPLSLPVKYNIKEKYFDCDGIYCSFNCMLAFLHETNTNYLYKDSYSYIYTLYKMLNGKSPPKNKIIQAPSWRMLKNYGGTLTIEEYRKTFDIVEFDNNPRQINLPLKPICNVFIKNN